MVADALYNEIDPFAAAWLDNLVRAGHIAPGHVDRRSVADLKPNDVAGAGQRHFFAGIGVWSHALRTAGWPDDVDVWTGSCPCQPFSQAGRRRGASDARHLWPTWFGLIAACRPPVVVGEQVASGDGLAWLDAVLADLEGAGYTCRAFDLCAAGVGAPHIRQRLYFVAIADGERLEGVRLRLRGWLVGDTSVARGGWHAGAVSPAQGSGDRTGGATRRLAHVAVAPGADGRLADDDDDERSQGYRAVERAPEQLPEPDGLVGLTRGFWADAEWIPCVDPRCGVVYRPVEPLALAMADGPAGGLGSMRADGDASLARVLVDRAPARVGRLRGYGNAIVAPLAATFLEALKETLLE